MKLLGLVGSTMNVIFAVGMILGLAIVITLLIKFWVIGLIVLILILIGVGVGMYESHKLIKQAEDSR